MQEKNEVCFAAVGDLHCTEDSVGTLRSLFAQASEAADALLLCGDLTDYGTVKEAKILADELTVVSEQARVIGFAAVEIPVSYQICLVSP